MRKVFRDIGVLQLDAISVVERTQFLVLFSRLGPYEVARLHEMTGPGGELFEYWGHAASLLPVAHQPLFRWRLEDHGPYGTSALFIARREAWQAANAGYIAAVLAEVRDRGPLTAAQLTDPRRRDGEWWERRSVGRQALEGLFAKGELAGWRTTSFERVYDLPER
ncbi:MAG TPA: crosslink repair DNA glycosylase YcaQ family protein, partial [Acidimicrobiales bacterium]|nr:crosslink repair DNA glycosylase YcaQ family protein [Acidimicrobiales bacterium]